MTGCDGVRMDTQTALWHRSHATWSCSHLLRGLGLVLLAALSSCLLWSWSAAPAGTTETRSIGQLVHWQDAGHDWLLVADPATRELVVYDANNGRPLERLGADDGLPDVQSIAQRGSLLFVTGRQPEQVHLLKLPQLQEVAFNAR